MRYFYKDLNGQVYEYESPEDREQFGPYDLTLMTDQEVESHLSPPSPVDVVPVSVTMRQARLALLQAGLLSQVEVAINALPEPPRTAARIEWDFSSEVYRDRDFVLMLGNTLGLTSEQMDDLFITAATL